jgi:hypothetical protein
MIFLFSFEIWPARPPPPDDPVSFVIVSFPYYIALRDFYAITVLIKIKSVE